jgi:hypothetical protein
MYLSSVRYEAICAFLNGYDTAMRGGILRGFREFLLCHCTRWNNLPWWLLVRFLATPDTDLAGSVPEDEEAQVSRALSEYLERFSDKVRVGGLAKVYWEYSQWLSLTQDREGQRLYNVLVRKP